MSLTTPRSTLPVAVIGAGPIGLAAAAHLLARGETPIVFEAGPAVGASIRHWSHVRFFSPWTYTVDAASVALQEPTGWSLPAPDGRVPHQLARQRGCVVVRDGIDRGADHRPGRDARGGRGTGNRCCLHRLTARRRPQGPVWTCQ